MAKDPAVLFYTQDFIVGSLLMSPVQKGYYITLLCHQQQSATGSLTESEIKALMGKDYPKNWPVIASKYKQDENGFYNERMRTEINKRKSYTEKQVDRINKRWNKSGKAPVDTTVLPNTGNTFLENEIEIEKKEGSVREGIAFDMLDTFKKAFPGYPVDQEKDLPAVMQIANKIADKHSWTKDSIVRERRPDIVKKWAEIVDFAASDKWFSTRAIADLNREWQRLMQSFKVPEKLQTNADINPKYSAREQEGRDIIFGKS